MPTGSPPAVTTDTCSLRTSVRRPRGHQQVARTSSPWLWLGLPSLQKQERKKSPGQAAAPGPPEEGSSGPTPASREGQVQQLQRQNPFQRGSFRPSWADPLSSPVALAPTCCGHAGTSV